MVTPLGAEKVLQPVAVDVRRVAAVAVRVGKRALVGLPETPAARILVEMRQCPVTAEEDVRPRVVAEVGDDSSVGVRVLGDAGVCGLVDGDHRYRVGSRCRRCARGGGLGRSRARLFRGLGRAAGGDAPSCVCAGAVAAERPDGQMVSTTPVRPPRVSRIPKRPIAHTREEPGAFATSNIALSFLPSPDISFGEAVQPDPSQCCVEAT